MCSYRLDVLIQTSPALLTGVPKIAKDIWADQLCEKTAEIDAAKQRKHTCHVRICCHNPSKGVRQQGPYLVNHLSMEKKEREVT